MLSYFQRSEKRCWWLPRLPGSLPPPPPTMAQAHRCVKEAKEQYQAVTYWDVDADWSADFCIFSASLRKKRDSGKTCLDPERSSSAGCARISLFLPCWLCCAVHDDEISRHLCFHAQITQSWLVFKVFLVHGRQRHLLMLSSGVWWRSRLSLQERHDENHHHETTRLFQSLSAINRGPSSDQLDLYIHKLTFSHHKKAFLWFSLIKIQVCRALGPLIFKYKIQMSCSVSVCQISQKSF